MSDSDANNVTGQGTAPEENPPVPRQVVDGPAIYEQTSAERRKQQRRSKFRKAPVWIEAACAVALVGITGFYTLYAHRQANTAQDTLNEIKTSGAKAGKQTDDLITAAQIQARAAIDNVAAARSFAKSATGINSETKSAVDQFQRMAKASENSIKTAQSTLDASIEVSRRDQRAWVGIHSIATDGEITNNTQGIKVNQVAVTIRNTGRTPARNLSAQSSIVGPYDWDKPVPDYGQSSAPNSTPIVSGMVVAPAAAWDINLLPYVIEYGNRIGPNGTQVIYIVGLVTYDDIFGATHTTKFCLMNDSYIHAKFGLCPKGNWMD